MLVTALMMLMASLSTPIAPFMPLLNAPIMVLGSVLVNHLSIGGDDIPDKIG